jgi:hypothetical protein
MHQKELDLKGVLDSLFAKWPATKRVNDAFGEASSISKNELQSHVAPFLREALEPVVVTKQQSHLPSRGKVNAFKALHLFTGTGRFDELRQFKFDQFTSTVYTIYRACMRTHLTREGQGDPTLQEEVVATTYFGF